MFPAMLILQIVEHNERLKREQIEDTRLSQLPHDQRDFELRLREIKALEARSRVRSVINVRTSIF